MAHWWNCFHCGNALLGTGEGLRNFTVQMQELQAREGLECLVTTLRAGCPVVDEVQGLCPTFQKHLRESKEANPDGRREPPSMCTLLSCPCTLCETLTTTWRRSNSILASWVKIWSAGKSGGAPQNTGMGRRDAESLFSPKNLLGRFDARAEPCFTQPTNGPA